MRSEHLLRLSRSSAPVDSVAPVDFAAPPACAIVHEQTKKKKCAARQSRKHVQHANLAPVDFAAPPFAAPACAIVHEQPTTFNVQHANLTTNLANKQEEMRSTPISQTCAARQSRTS